MRLVESVNTRDSSPDAKELLPILQEAVKIYGVDNVRVYVAERQKDGFPSQYLEICCYKREKP